MLQPRAYVHFKKAEADAAALRKLEKPPTAEQLAFIQAVVERCNQEAKELPQAVGQRGFSEPLRACLLGIPGAGKSECIKWVRRFFEDCSRLCTVAGALRTLLSLPEVCLGAMRCTAELSHFKLRLLYDHRLLQASARAWGSRCRRRWRRRS